ncbi:MAG: hypothetical protein Q8S11_05960 [Daejeonella sp.]|uniref:hypothetical protein n=1 Tax=Daejeonella sp. TaxID=2805397 RepID=UPI00273511F6|nr:hypothetical protein [Daejeonella sp.]MDP3467859.1 hypothetical protein [Daejeonella sp.]
MKKKFAKKIFSFVFLFIFFVKMVISIAPLIANQIDNRIVNAVIMQLEIETNASKGVDQAKESPNKGEWLNGIFKFNLSSPQNSLALKKYSTNSQFLIESFYPSVPTPPPNC